MKRYIRSATTEYSGEDLPPYLVKGLVGEGNYGESDHKKYRGVPIRDFRNNWLGLDDVSDIQDAMDIALDAYDEIKDTIDPNLQIRFFNGFSEGSAWLMCYTQDADGRCGAEIRVNTKEPNKCSVTVGDHYAGDEYDLSINDLVEAYARGKAANDTFVERSQRARNAYKTTKMSNQKSKFAKLTSGDFSSSEITIPIEIYLYDWQARTDQGLPTDEEVISALYDSVDIESLNRYFNKVEVRSTYSGICIILTPKVKTRALRVDHQGKSISTQFNGVFNDLRWEYDRYLKKLIAKFS